MDSGETRSGLGITRHDMPDGSVVLELTGYIDLSTVAQMAEAIGRALTDAREIRLDLTGLTFLDSTGLREFVIGYQHAEASGVGFRVVNPQGHVRQVLEVTGMLAYLTEGVEADGIPGSSRS